MSGWIVGQERAGVKGGRPLGIMPESRNRHSQHHPYRHSRLHPYRHSQHPYTVIPAQAGIQKCPIGSMPVFGIAVLDSRLRGNDGVRGRSPSPMSFRPLSYVIPSVAEESENLEMESRAGIVDSSATLGMT